MPGMSASEFLQNLSQNPDLQQQLGLAGGGADLGQFVASARAAGYDFTEQEILEAVQAQPLSENQLDEVSGGLAGSSSIILVGGYNFNPALRSIVIDRQFRP